MSRGQKQPTKRIENIRNIEETPKPELGTWWAHSASSIWVCGMTALCCIPLSSYTLLFLQDFIPNCIIVLVCFLKPPFLIILIEVCNSHIRGCIEQNSQILKVIQRSLDYRSQVCCILWSAGAIALITDIYDTFSAGFPPFTFYSKIMACWCVIFLLLGSVWGWILQIFFSCTTSF